MTYGDFLGDVEARLLQLNRRVAYVALGACEQVWVGPLSA